MELGTNSGSLYYVNAVIMTVCIWMLPALYVVYYEPVPIPWFSGYDGFVLLVLLVIVHKMGFYRFIGYMSRKESHIVLQLCPLVVLLMTGFAIHYSYLIERYSSGWLDYALIPQWCVIYILARFGSPGDGCPFHKGVKVAARISRAILLVAVICVIAQRFGPMGFLGLLGPLVLGNLQTPLALARIMISWVWLFWNETEIYDTENENVKLAVKILYIMVMCQGILYILACILESLSFLLRRSLALDCGLVDKSGMGSIDLYYEHAYDTFLQESVFDTTKKMSLVTFAVDSLNPKSSRDNKSAAVRILDSFMQRWNKTCYICNTKLISLITTSPKAVTTLINMLGWTVTEDADIRLFAAKVTAHLAPHVQIIRIPGTTQMVSSLLDAQDEPMTHGILVQIVDGNGGNADDDQQVSNGASSPTVNSNESDVEDRQQMGHGSSNSPLDIEGGNIPAVQASLTLATQNNSEGCSVIERICRFLGYVQKLWSIPQEDMKDEDSLPALGMNILEGLAHDLHNCEEISRTTELLPKIIGFISYIPGPTTSHQKEIATSSLKLVGKLASVKGEIGIKLRRELSDNPFLIGNLTEILEDEGNSSYLEQSKLAMYIITNIAMDKKTRQEIGTVQVIIDKLVQEFIGEDELSNPLRAEAGQALAMLAIESPNNCSAMLHKTGELIGDLANKLQRGVHVYQAVSLLQSLCKNSRQLVLSHQGSDDRLLSTMTVVLGRIKDAEGKQVEALISLASQICSVMSERIAPVLDPFADDEAFVKKLVGELNARKKPSPDESPETRSLLVVLTVSIVEFCPRYAPIFKEHRMMEALSKVERYTGEVSEEDRALRAIVATAKRMIGVDTP